MTAAFEEIVVQKLNVAIYATSLDGKLSTGLNQPANWQVHAW